MLHAAPEIVKPKRARRGWWGTGPPPWERWAGTTLKLDAKWSAARKRWESPCGKYFFDAEAADRAVSFFPNFLSLTKARSGEPFVLMPWHEFLVVRPLFGWKRSSDGLRRFGKVFIAAPKGNAKTPLGAGLCIQLTFADGELGADGYVVAGDKEQARVLFDDARQMVETNPDLTSHREGPQIEVLTNAIFSHKTNSSMKLVSSTAGTKHGTRPHVVVIDEMHVQRDRNLFEAFRKSMGKRDQPVLIMLTHAGDDDESICYEEWDLSLRLMAGTAADDSYLPVIFAATPDEDPHSPKTWNRVNPGLGISTTIRGMEDESRAAKNEPRKLNDFLRYNLNRWVNDAVAWFPVDLWDANAAKLADDAALAKLLCCGGLDMAQKIDLASFVLAFKHPIDATPLSIEHVEIDTDGKPIPEKKRSLNLNYAVSLLPLFWIPEATMHEREKVDRVPYSQWAREGLIIPTEGTIIDPNRIFADIVALAKRFPLMKQAEIGYDPAFATDIALSLQAEGFKVVEVKQNWGLSEPSYMLEALLKAKRVQHGGHRVLRWCAENVAVKTDSAARIRPVKPRRQAKRVDGVIASIMALSRLHVMQPPKKSVYNTRGMISF